MQVAGTHARLQYGTERGGALDDFIQHESIMQRGNDMHVDARILKSPKPLLRTGMMFCDARPLIASINTTLNNTATMRASIENRVAG